MSINNLPQVATQCNSDATRDSNPGHRARIPSALTTGPPSNRLGGPEWRSLASSVVASVPSDAFIALRPLRQLRTAQLRPLRCVAYVACVALDGSPALRGRLDDISLQ